MEQQTAATDIREHLITQLGSWIETNVLAEALVDAMADHALPEEMTLENAQKVYLDFLENELSDGLRRSVIYPRGA